MREIRQVTRGTSFKTERKKIIWYGFQLNTKVGIRKFHLAIVQVQDKEMYHEKP